jgi:hypothetical protein
MEPATRQNTTKDTETLDFRRMPKKVFAKEKQVC